MNNRSQLLIVDDEPSMHLLLEALLEKETFDLHFARNGAEGIAMAISIQSDVILLDVMMPKMNGNATHGMD